MSTNNDYENFYISGFVFFGLNIICIIYLIYTIITNNKYNGILPFINLIFTLISLGVLSSPHIKNTKEENSNKTINKWLITGIIITSVLNIAYVCIDIFASNDNDSDIIITITFYIIVYLLTFVVILHIYYNEKN